MAFEILVKKVEVEDTEAYQETMRLNNWAFCKILPFAILVWNLFVFFIRYIDGGPPAGEPDMSSSIWRRYSEFELLRNYLIANFPAVSKHIMLTLFWYQLIVFGICLSLYFLQQINTSRNSVHLNWIIQKKLLIFVAFGWIEMV